jgi:hypothetical protein
VAARGFSRDSRNESLGFGEHLFQTTGGHGGPPLHYVIMLEEKIISALDRV